MSRTAVSRRRGRRRGGFRLVMDVALAAAILGLLGLVSMRLDRVETRRAEGVPTVNDGDSLTFGGERIRLRGIDAPEFGQTCRRDAAAYACGRQSRQALVELIGGRTVACSGWERDRYGRLLAACTAGGTDLNRSMVETGWAIAYGDFGEAEARARGQRLGLWAGEFERPRDWRQTHGSLVESEHDTFGRIMNWLRALLGLGAV